MTMIATARTVDAPPDLAPALVSVAERMRNFSDGHRQAARALRRSGNEIASLREEALADAAATACWSIENGGASSSRDVVARLTTPPSSPDPVALAEGRDFVLFVLERALPGRFVRSSAREVLS